MPNLKWDTPAWEINKELVPAWVWNNTINYENFIKNNIEAIARAGNFIPICVMKDTYKHTSQTCVLLSKQEIKELTEENHANRKWYLIPKETVLRKGPAS